jgi:hypothetical protein
LVRLRMRIIKNNQRRWLKIGHVCLESQWMEKDQVAQPLTIA